MAETKKQDDVDPRHRLAQRYMQAARDELAAKEADQPKVRQRRPARTEGQPKLADLKPSISGSTFIHGLMLMFVLSGAGLGLVLCYSLLNTVWLIPETGLMV